MQIVLGSSSPRRLQLLKEAGFDFIVYKPEVDETIDKNISVKENVKALGLKKALKTKEIYKDALVIGCDTIVALDGVIYGKPKDEDDAFLMLKNFSGKTHQVLSGYAIIYKDIIYNDVVESLVTFNDLTNEDINNYIKTKECFNKAGSYAIQGIGKKLVKEYSGELENIIGLPIKEVKEIILEIGEKYGV